ncbi:MAG: hypothetical protein ACYC0Q_02160 [Eubacteriales bacterium]
MKRPNFDTFRDIFLECLAGCAGSDNLNRGDLPWVELGEKPLRQKVLEQVRERVRSDYGVDFEVNNRLLSVAGTVESAVIQTYHELNTIYLMEKINEKIRARMN